MRGRPTNPVLAVSQRYLWYLRTSLRIDPETTRLWLLTTVVSGLLTPVQVWVFGRVAQEVVGTDGATDTSSVWAWALAGCLVLILNRALSYSVFWYCGARFQERVASGLRDEVNRKSVAVDLAQFEDQDFYDRHTRSIVQIEERAAGTMRDFMYFLMNLVQMGGLVVLAASLAWYLPVLILAPLLLIASVSVTKGQQRYEDFSDQARDRRLADYYAASLSDRTGAKEVRLWGAAPYLISRWQELFWETRSGLRRKVLRNALGQRLLSSAGLLVTVFVAIVYVIATLDEQNAASATVVVQLIILFPDVSLLIGMLLYSAATNSGYTEDVRSFLSMKEEDYYSRPDPLFKLGTSIDVSGAHFAYPSSQQAVLRGVDLSIAAGESIAIVGVNGAGKSTLGKLILGLYAPSQGVVRYDGVDIAQIPFGDRLPDMAAVFQGAVKYPGTVMDNLVDQRTANEDDAARVTRTLAAAGAIDFVRDLPSGTETVVTPELGGLDLSGGQWQRIALARAIHRGDGLVLLDEPNAALDPLAEARLFAEFKEVIGTRTAIAISHRLGICKSVDRVVVLDNGVIAESGSHDELVSRGGLYATLWHTQAEWYR